MRTSPWPAPEVRRGLADSTHAAQPTSCSRLGRAAQPLTPRPQLGGLESRCDRKRNVFGTETVWQLLSSALDRAGAKLVPRCERPARAAPCGHRPPRKQKAASARTNSRHSPTSESPVEHCLDRHGDCYAAFAHRQDCEREIVARMVACHIALAPAHMRERIDAEGRVVDKDSAPKKPTTSPAQPATRRRVPASSTAGNTSTL